MGKEMTLLEHLQELRDRVVRIIITVIGIGVFSFVFKIESYNLNGGLSVGGVDIPITRIYYPYPNVFENMASQFIKKIADDMLPEEVMFIFTSPEQAIVAELYVAIFLGVLIGMPVVVREIGAFVNPALYPNERRMILTLLAPATILFATGCIFSYLWVTPFALDFLYRYAAVFEGGLFITPLSLISFVIMFIVAIGLSFELPVIMWLLSKAGLVDAGFWWENFRYAVVAMVIFGAVITPDGSGVTMWLVAGPMIALYLAGYLIIKRQIGSKTAAMI